MRSCARRRLYTGQLRQDEATEHLLAQKLGVSLQRVNTLINGRRDMSAETALLLAGAFKTSPEFWMNLQMACDLYEAKKRLPHAA